MPHTTLIDRYGTQSMVKKVNGSSAEYIGSQTKIERFGWVTLDTPGVYMDLPKESLIIDPQYQRYRAPGHKAILAMAAKWSYAACGTLAIGRRGGEYYVMDGQGRKLAAEKRVDIRTLPCMVHETDHFSDEAFVFLLINHNRRPVMVLEKFNALVAVDDPHAKFVHDLLATTNHVISQMDSGTIKCAGILIQCAERDRAALKRIWPVLMELCGDKALTTQLATAVFTFERLANPGVSLSRPPWRTRFLRVGHRAMVTAVQDAVRAAGPAQSLWGASGIAKKVNHGMRSLLVQLKADPHPKAEVPLRASVRDLTASENARLMGQQ